MSIPEQFQPLLTAFVARGQQVLAAPELTPEQFASLAQSIGLMYRSMQPTNFTVLDVTAEVDHLLGGFTFAALSGKPFLVVVNGLVLRHTKWGWVEASRTLILNEGYKFPVGAVVELYTFWNGDEIPPSPPTS